MKKPKNPFITRGYHSPEYFCNRDKESKKIIDAMENGRNITLYGRRKLGKTALVKHVFHLKQKDMYFIWMDLFPTQDFKSFIDLFSTNIFNLLYEKQSSIKKFLTGIGSLRPVISYDEMTGIPQVKLDVTDYKSQQVGFESLLGYLRATNRKIVIAFDEFQQILEYPEQNIEAYLRTIIQEIPEISFIFMGSDQHLLNEMFSSSKRPFYQMSQLMRLEKLEHEVYVDFIFDQFKKGKIAIDRSLLHEILDWSKGITYFVQMICNRLYSLDKKYLSQEDLKAVFSELIHEFEDSFYVFRRMLTKKQWRVLSAVAMETSVSNLYSKDFLMKYNFYNASSIKRAIESLEKHNLVYKTFDKEGKVSYELQDLFLEKWVVRNG